MLETLQERVAFLEGRAAEHSQVMENVRDGVAGLKADLKDGFAFFRQQFVAIDERFTAIDRRFAATDQRFAAIDQRFVAIDQRFVSIDHRFVVLEDRMARQFYWIVGIQITTFIATLGAILAVNFGR